MREETRALTGWQGRAFYEAHRPDYALMLPYAAFVEVAGDCHLPSHVYHDDRVQRLRRLMALGEGLLNDAFSHEHGCDEPEGLRAVAAWHNECVRESVRLRDESIRAFGGEYPQIETYVRGNHAVFRGSAEWTVGTARYGRLPGYELRVVQQDSSLIRRQ